MLEMPDEDKFGSDVMTPVSRWWVADELRQLDEQGTCH